MKQIGGGVETKPTKDNALGLVYRKNGSFESICQRLQDSLMVGKNYKIVLSASISEKYMSRVAGEPFEQNFDDRLVVDIWMGSTVCHEALLAGRTNEIDHKEWKEYSFEFIADEAYDHIFIRVNSIDNRTNILDHVLIDWVSDIKCLDP